MAYHIGSNGKSFYLSPSENWQTKSRGSDKDEYQIYVDCVTGKDGLDITTGKVVKTFNQWLNS